ncbi:WD40 repeat protein [Catenulispora sp. MAP5-51]
MPRISRVTSVEVVGFLPTRSVESRQHPFNAAAFLSRNKISGARDKPGGDLEVTLNQVDNLLKGRTPARDVPMAAQFLVDFDILAARTALYGGDVTAVVTDLDNTARLLAPIHERAAAQLLVLAQALRRSAGILRLAPHQLPEQVILRLNGESGHLLRRLVTRAEHYKTGLWMRPMTPAARSPHEIVKHLQGNASDACFAPDGRLLIVDNQRLLEVLDLAGGRPRQPFRLGAIEPTSLACDGTYAAIATRDGTIRIVELARGQRPPLVPSGPGAALAVAFIRPGILVSANTRGRLTSWDVAAGAEIGRIDIGDRTISALLPLDGDRILLGTDPETSTSPGHALQIWNLSAGRREATFGSHDWPVTALARAAEGGDAGSGGATGAAPDLVVAAANDQLSAWRLDDLSCAWRATREHVAFHSVRCLPGRAVVGDGIGALRLFDIHDGRELRRLAPHSGLIPAIASDPERRRLATVSYDQSVRVWDTSALEAAAPMRHQQEVTTLALTADRAHVLSAGKDGRVLAWDAETGEFEGELGGHAGWVSRIVPMPGAAAVSAGWDGMIRFWDLRQAGCSAAVRSDDPQLTQLAVTADGTSAVTAGAKGVIRIWDLARRQQTAMTAADEDDTVVAVAIDGGGVRWLAESGRLWSWRPGAEPVQTPFVAGLPGGGRVTACDFGQHGGSSVIGFADGRIVAVTDDGVSATVLADAPCGATAIARDVSGEIVVATFGLPYTASDNTARLWTAGGHGPIADLVGDSPWTAAAVSDDGRTVYLGEESGGVHVIQVMSPRLKRPGLHPDPNPARR